MKTQATREQDEAQVILEALHQIRDNDELGAEAAKNPESVMDRLGLSGIARHAVAFGIAGMLVAPAVMRPHGWWNS
jgi:hypothetical protein